MPLDELTAHGSRVMTVCNACRYCEQYCPVFPAMEERRTFGKIDLAYLANLCHNCGECLYACQYAPPHEFGINVPRTLAQIRLRSYEDYAWPRALGAAFAKNNLVTGIGLAGALSLAMYLLSAAMAPDAWSRSPSSGDFYAVVPHGVMVGIFGSVFVFAVVAVAIGVRRFLRDIRQLEAGAHPRNRSRLVSALGDALTLRHLRASGADCVSSEERRTPWRRWMHHSTLYGFLLCFASTSVAAMYHSVFGWRAPYPYTSLPVVLGTLGGIGLLLGTAGLWILRRHRDDMLGDPAQQGLDESFLALLFLTSLSGLALLALRHQPIMAPLLIVHLGTVAALFVTLPYGKFVHGAYRIAALTIAGRR